MRRPTDQTRRSRLLVCDDTASGRATIEAALVREGHEIVHAESGAECLRLAAELPPDLILLDVMMPVMDGFEVCRRLRADPALRSIPVVLVTALSDNDSMARGLEAGADDFLGKPFNKWELRARVSSLMRLSTQQRALAERDRFFWVFEHAADGFVLLDRAGTICECNAAGRRLLGFGADEPVAGDFVARLSRDTTPSPADAWDLWRDGPPPQQPFFVVRAVPGAYYREWVQVSAHSDPQDPEGMVVVALRDVTLQVERQMRQFEFHELVSHKLRTPLFGIVGAVDLLARSREQFADPRAQDMIDIAVTSATRLNEAVTDVLQYAGDAAATETPLPLRRFAGIVHDTAAEQQVQRVTVRMAPGLSDAALPLGEVATQAVLRELIENARRFHPEQDPAVSVRVADLDGGWLRIEVEDDGVRMTPRQLERALLPYVQGDPELTGEVPGMGLGLSLVATRVRGAGGRCAVENRRDRPGVCVSLDLPQLVSP